MQLRAAAFEPHRDRPPAPQDVLKRAKHDPQLCGPAGAVACTDGRINDLFFTHQERGDWPEMVELPAFKRLMAQFMHGFEQYFRALGVKQYPDFDPNVVTAWFSVHYSGSSHGPHNHEGAKTCAAGIMYLAVPEGSGAHHPPMMLCLAA